MYVNPQQCEALRTQDGVGPDRYMTISEHRAYRFGTSVQTTSVHVNDYLGT